MELIKLIILATVGGVFSLSGALVLLNNQKAAKFISHIAAPFAAGALLAAVLIDLLPEAIELEKSSVVLLWTLAGIAIFFLLERRLSWFHHHHEHEDDDFTTPKKRIPAMLVVGDTIHNAIDGIAIAVAFLANPSLGIITAVAVAVHEIPQEIGDFGLLLKAGWSNKKVVYVNILSALACVVAAVIVYFIGSSAEQLIAPSLGIVSGTLLYIALSDVLPTVHETKSGRKWFDNASLLFVLGIVMVWLAIFVAKTLEAH